MNIEYLIYDDWIDICMRDQMYPLIATRKYPISQTMRIIEYTDRYRFHVSNVTMDEYIEKSVPYIPKIKL